MATRFPCRFLALRTPSRARSAGVLVSLVFGVAALATAQDEAVTEPSPGTAPAPAIAGAAPAPAIPGTVPAPATQGTAAAPAVPLEQLLKVPHTAPAVESATVDRKGGRTRTGWQARYRSAQLRLERAESDLAATRAKLDEVSGGSSQWKMSAPGLGNAEAPLDSPLDYKLSQNLKRQREELQGAQRSLQDLDVEANLAGVPQSWREPGSTQR